MNHWLDNWETFDRCLVFPKKHGFKYCSEIFISFNPIRTGARSNFWGLSGSEYRAGGDNSIQFINIGRVSDKSFKE